MGVTLVAEDDMSTMLVICSILKKMGHLPIRARNGRIAWDILCDNADNIDLVINSKCCSKTCPRDLHKIII